jgi:hypothetical protein
MAERKGFEPLIQFYPYTFLAGRCLQPLGHLSMSAIKRLRILYWGGIKSNFYLSKKIDYF